MVDHLRKLYGNFYKELSLMSKKSYRADQKTFLLRKEDTLTKTQRCHIKDFWLKYTKDFDIGYHAYYINRTNNFDVRYIPDDIFAGYIDGFLNNREIENGIADKNYFDMYLKGFNLPETYVHLINGQYLDKDYNLITMEKATQILSDNGSFISKPSMNSYGGKNVMIYEGMKEEQVQTYLKKNENGNIIFQEVLKQSNATAFLHKESVNTIRIMTLLINGEIKTLHSSFRIGVGNSRIDNASAGGIYCAINDDGSLSEYAYDAIGNKFEKHPGGGEFSECRIPCMDKVRELVKKAAERFPHFRLIGWDIAINGENEPVIIEANLTMSGLDVVQTICGPVFKEYTEAVLDEVFKKEKRNDFFFDFEQYI
jgi:hypothetical protein